MSNNNSIEIVSDIEYIKKVLFKYNQGKLQKEELPDDFCRRCDFVIEQFKNIFSE